MHLLMKTFVEEKDGMLPPECPEFVAIDLGSFGSLLAGCSKVSADLAVLEELTEMPMEKIVFRLSGASFWFADHGGSAFDFHSEVMGMGCALVNNMPEKSPDARSEFDLPGIDQAFITFHSSNPTQFFLEADMLEHRAVVFSQQFELADIHKLLPCEGLPLDQSSIAGPSW